MISSANSGAGTFHLQVGSIGGFFEVAAGVGIFFRALADDPQQRFSALIDYSDMWHDHAMGYVAHNDLNTRLWVWGEAENAWVGKGEVTPGWMDGVGWFDTHGNYPDGDDGRASGEIFFPVMANNWYLAWVWSDGSVYADGGWFGFSDSWLELDISIPFVVFGSL